MPYKRDSTFPKCLKEVTQYALETVSHPTDDDDDTERGESFKGTACGCGSTLLSRHVMLFLVSAPDRQKALLQSLYHM